MSRDKGGDALEEGLIKMGSMCEARRLFEFIKLR